MLIRIVVNAAKRCVSNDCGSFNRILFLDVLTSCKTTGIGYVGVAGVRGVAKRRRGTCVPGPQNGNDLGIAKLRMKTNIFFNFLLFRFNR